MSRTASPLRYPGGKTTLYPLVANLLRENRLERVSYAEPFAGGCGLALNLLYDGYVSEIYINDVDAGIWAFWYSILHHTDEFGYRIRKTPITVKEWHRQCRIHKEANEDDVVALGFAAFFLNRTNRSGVIKEAGVIGGLDQTGPYKIDCRFNREDLERRVRRVANYSSQIHLTRMDALDFMRDLNGAGHRDAFLCIDPPYYRKGKGLYTSYYDPDDHKILAEFIRKLENPWIVTYDNVPEISQLYRDRRQFEFDVNYSIETKRQATELLIASKGLRIPSDVRQRMVNRPQYRATTPA